MIERLTSLCSWDCVEDILLTTLAIPPTFFTVLAISKLFVGVEPLSKASLSERQWEAVDFCPLNQSSTDLEQPGEFVVPDMIVLGLSVMALAGLVFAKMTCKSCRDVQYYEDENERLKKTLQFARDATNDFQDRNTQQSARLDEQSALISELKDQLQESAQRQATLSQQLLVISLSPLLQPQVQTQEPEREEFKENEDGDRKVYSVDNSRSSLSVDDFLSL